MSVEAPALPASQADGDGADAVLCTSSRRIPLYIRIVPKDIWLRIHVDLGSTIASVKDAVLDRIGMPATDPTLQSTFYEQACAASKSSTLPTTSNGAFPKSFLAREPKRTLEEVLAVDEAKRANEARVSETQRAAAYGILRGDPGDGGLGYMQATAARSGRSHVHQEPYDATLVAGLDAYTDYLEQGNEAAAVEAASIDVAPSQTLRNAASNSSSSDAYHSSSEGSSFSQAVVDENTDIETDIDDDARAMSVSSSSSDSAETTHDDIDLQREEKATGPAESSEAAIEEAGPKQRARSSTIRANAPPKVDYHVAGVENDQLEAAQDADTGEHEAAPTAGTHGAADVETSLPARGARTARSGTVVQHSAPHVPLSASAPTHESTVDAPDLVKTTNSSSRAQLQESAERLAGIHADEISSWQSAKHAMAHCYTIHSYSNGNMVEDWRTIAALRVRPFELLEMQYAHPQYRIHIGRSGRDNPAEARNASDASRSALLEDSPDATLSSNPAMDTAYSESILEGWCYTFKRGSGPSKAQRAGVGVWKLRWVAVRGSRLAIHRKRPSRGEALNSDGEAWDLRTLDAVFSERADGTTRPPLPLIAGLSKEVVTISFDGQFLQPDSTYESDAYYKPIISMRFVTITDHHTFFSCFARTLHQRAPRSAEIDTAPLTSEWRRRAVARATIAGMGGTVLPGRASRRRGRNALSRPRLRPPGVSREFDDADRWSSESESEDILPRRSRSFYYGESSSQTGLASLPWIPTLLEFQALTSGRIPAGASKPALRANGLQIKTDSATIMKSRLDVSSRPQQGPGETAARISQVSEEASLSSSLVPMMSALWQSSPLAKVRPEDTTPRRLSSTGSKSDQSERESLLSLRSPSMTSFTAHDARRLRRFDSVASAASATGSVSDAGSSRHLDRQDSFAASSVSSQTGSQHAHDLSRQDSTSHLAPASSTGRSSPPQTGALWNNR